MIDNLKVERVVVSNLVDSIRAAKFSYAVNTENCDGFMKDRQVKLAQSPAGSGHDCWLKGVGVSFDLTISVKALVQAERYGHFDIVSSQSTMHKIASMDISDSCIKYVDERCIVITEELKRAYLENPTEENFLALIYSFPVGLMLTMRINTNYMQLKTIYKQRKSHRLPEWKEFCKWIETLPYSFLITGDKEQTENYIKEAKRHAR